MIFETIRTNRIDCEVPEDYFDEIKEVRVINESTDEVRIFREVDDQNDD